MSFNLSAVPSYNGSTNIVQSALILDDSEFDRKRIMRLNSKLAKPLALEGVSDIASMNNCLNAKSFDLIMIDYGLGNEDGLTALDTIQRHRLNQSAAKIMISASTEEALMKSALRRGCSDFVSKKDLTVEKFEKSIDQALRKSKTGHLEHVLRAAATDENLHDVVKQAVEAALADMDQSQTQYYTTYNDRDLYKMVVDIIHEDDEFIFR